MDDSLFLQLSGCSPSTPSPRSHSICRLVPLLSTPAKAPEFAQTSRLIEKASVSSVLQGVVAYVDVRTESDNRSRAVGFELEHLGATVVDRFTDDVTHFVYKDGKKRSLDMALRRKIHLVSVLWVESCKQNQRKVSEDEFRVALPKKQTPTGPLRLKRYRSMQPKTFDEEVVLSEERIRRKQQKREKMILKTPESGRKTGFFVAETCRRSPNIDEVVSPMAICVPDTPPSMRRHVARRSVRVACDGLSSPEIVSLSSASLKLRLSCDDDSCHSDTIDSSEARNSRKTVRGTADVSSSLPAPLGEKSEGPLCEKSEGPDSFSPVIELQKSRPLGNRHFLNSSSSFDCERDQIKSKSTPDCWRSREVSSVVENGLRTHLRRLSDDEKLGSALKRKSSPSLDEETAFNTKRFRMEEEINSKVSFIPLSQLNSPKNSKANGKATTSRLDGIVNGENDADTSGYSVPKNAHKVTAARRKSTSALARGGDINIMDSVGLSLPESTRKNSTPQKIDANSMDHKGVTDTLDTSGYSVPNDILKNDRKIEHSGSRRFARSSPTSSQEASFVCSIDDKTLIDRRFSKVAKNISTPKRVTFKELTPTSRSRHLPDDEHEGRQNSATSEQNLETFKENCRKLCNDLRLKNDAATAISKTGNTPASPNVALQRLPDAWNQVKSVNTSGDSPAAAKKSRKSMCTNLLRQMDCGQDSRLDSVEGSMNASDEVEIEELRRESKNSSRARKKSGENSKKIGKGITTDAVKSLPVSVSSANLDTKHSTPSIVVTSLHRGDQSMVGKAVLELGGYVLAEEVDDNTTHVVSGENRRTIKLLAGISRGLWIVSLDWVKDSVNKGRWLPEKCYELTDHFPAAKISRDERRRCGVGYKQDLFSQVGEVFVADCSSPPKSDLEHLIELCSGKITKQIRNARICIGKFLRHSITNVGEKWILDSIMMHRCLPTDDYILNA